MSVALSAHTDKGWPNRLADTLGAPLAELSLTLAAEHIRASTSAPGLRSFSSYDFRPAHTAHIMASVRRNVAPWFGQVATENDDDTWSRLRELLQTIGDIAHIGEGYWIPGPTRFIEVEGTDKCLLLGGSPFHSLFKDTRRGLSSFVASRFVPRELVTRHKYEPEALSTWLPLDGPLDSWMEDAFARLRRVLQSDQSVEVQRAEIYAPDLFRAQRKSGYWISPEEFNDNSQQLRLFRSKTAKGWEHTRQYYVGSFQRKDGVLTLSESAKVSRDDAARMRFGWDLRSKACRRVEFATNGKIFEIDLRFSLPAPEAKVLALGWKRKPKEQSIQFELTALPFVRATLSRLHVSMFERA